jgi:hypothetical protein
MSTMKPTFSFELRRIRILFVLGLMPFACADEESEHATADAGSPLAPELDASTMDAAEEPSVIDGAIVDVPVRDASVRDAGMTDGAPSLGDSGCEGSCVGLEELQPPIVWWTQQWIGGLCSATVAVDGAYRVWEERGCESAFDLEVTGSTTEQIFDSLRDQIDALQSYSDAGEAGACEVLHAFGHRTAVSEISSSACGTALDDIDGLPASFATLVGTFQSLP